MTTVTKPTLQESLTEALMDEYKARAFYRNVILAFGRTRPFTNIVEAEQRHVEALLVLFKRYDIPVPQDDWEERTPAPNTLLAACHMAVEAEIANAAMYDRLIAVTDETDVRGVFVHLQSASRDHHLPAFQRCVARGGARVPACGGARGRRCAAGEGDSPMRQRQRHRVDPTQEPRGPMSTRVPI